MAKQPISITTEATSDQRSNPFIAMKISGKEFEVNVLIPDTDLSSLNKVRDTCWEDGSLRIGMSANSDVYWSCDNDVICLLIGSDDQSWDICVYFDAKYMVDILSEIKRTKATSLG